MTKHAESTRLTALQLELLRIFTYQPTNEELLELKRFLTQLFEKRLTTLTAQAAITRRITDEDLDKWLDDENQ
jgi:hypothetical protein